MGNLQFFCETLQLRLPSAGWSPGEVVIWTGAVLQPLLFSARLRCRLAAWRARASGMTCGDSCKVADGSRERKKALVQLGGVLYLSVAITTQKEKNMLLSCLSRFKIACCHPFIGSAPLWVGCSSIFGLWNDCEICILPSLLKFWLNHHVFWGVPLFSFVFEMF